MKKSKLRKLNKVILFIFIVGALAATAFFATSKTYAYWGGSVSAPELAYDTADYAEIGRWIQLQLATDAYPDTSVNDGKKGNLIHLWPVEHNVRRGDVVIKNGEAYIAVMNLDLDDPYLDPENEQPNWYERIRYRQNDQQYREFHKYYKGDYVLFEGKTYRWDIGIPHYPNTIDAGSPLEKPNSWKLISEEEQQYHWFRYVFYFEDDIVYYNGKWYAAKYVEGVNVMNEPSNEENEYGVLVNEYDNTATYNPDDIVYIHEDGIIKFYKLINSDSVSGVHPQENPLDWRFLEEYEF